MRPNSVPPRHRRRAARRNPLLVTGSPAEAHTELIPPSDSWPGTPLIDAIELLTQANQPESMIEAIELLTRAHQSESMRLAVLPTASELAPKPHSASEVRAATMT